MHGPGGSAKIDAKQSTRTKTRSFILEQTLRIKPVMRIQTQENISQRISSQCVLIMNNVGVEEARTQLERNTYPLRPLRTPFQSIVHIVGLNKTRSYYQ